ncbi:RBBP9/YdeN family alpha/beta hydrolase [Rhodocyclaceae bacterium SMB388]
MLTTLIVPGLHGSGPTHWQSWMETLIPGARRVEQDDWGNPDLDRWSARVAEQIDTCDGGAIVVAHSFGCLASVRASMLRPGRIKGAMLVAPADPKKFGVSNRLASVSLDVPSAVVGSQNDPWMTVATARYWALRWGCRFIDIGAAGHINVDSGYGPWPEGYVFYEALRETATRFLVRRGRFRSSGPGGKVTVSEGARRFASLDAA